MPSSSVEGSGTGTWPASASMKPSMPYDLFASPGPAAPTFSDLTVKLPSTAVMPVHRAT